jgi:hypothetical protein
MKIDLRDSQMMMVIKMVNAGMTPAQIQDAAIKHAKVGLDMDYIRCISRLKYSIFGDCWEEEAEKIVAYHRAMQDRANNNMNRMRGEARKAITHSANAHDVKQTQRDYMREKRAEMLKRGVCTQCWTNNAVNGTLCEPCKVKKRAQTIRYNEKHKEEIKSRRAEQQRIWMQNKRKEREDAGKCRQCGNPLNGRKYNCESCQNIANARQRQRWKFNSMLGSTLLVE